MRNELKMYRVYGREDDWNSFDEYCEASSPQRAVDRVREWHGEGYEVIEVSRVIKGWK